MENGGYKNREFGQVFLFNGISTFNGYLVPNIVDTY